MLYRKKWKAVLFIAPAAVFFLVFIFYPFFMNIFNSLFEITALGGKAGEWNAFENYRTMFKDADMPVSYTHLDVYKRQAPVP